MKEIEELMEVKPEIIALDATSALRPGGKTLDEFFREVKEKYPEQLFMADCSTVEEALSLIHIWYVDMMDNLEDYVGKTVRYSGQVLKSRDLEAGFFVPGRMAMTCCADDTQFIGYVCKWPDSKRLKMGSWVTVTAKIAEEYMDCLLYTSRCV